MEPEFNKTKKEEAQKKGEIVSHDTIEPGESETGANPSPGLKYRPQDFPNTRVDLGETSPKSEVTESPLESSLPKSVSASDIAQQSGAFWRGSGKQGSL